ncbi:MAG: DUF892 family protein [Bacteroidota bacterium]
MENTTLLQKKMLVNELRNMYWAEKYFLRILPKLERAAGTRYLKACFKGHLSATREHVSRLDEIFKLLNDNAKGKKWDELSSVIAQTMHVINSTTKNTLLRDVSLIEAARLMESYEIGQYEKLIKASEDLGEFKVATLLEETLYEEKEAQETFVAVKKDTLNDEYFKVSVEEEFDEFEAAEEE